MKKENVLFIGNFGAGNLGDESILMAALKKYPGARVMTADPDISWYFCGEEFQAVPFFPTGIRSFVRYLISKKYRQAIKDGCTGVTKVVFPGGGLFAITFRAYFIWWQVARCVSRFCPKAEIVWESQGVDETHSALKHWMMRSVFARAKSVTVRDDASKNFVQKLYTKKVENVGDCVDVFLSGEDFSRLKKKHGTNLVLVQARAKISEELQEKILKMYPDHMIGFLAFDPSDIQFCFQGTTFCAYPGRYDELCELIASADVLIGERLHSLVYGHRILGQKKVRLLREPYSQKVENYADRYQIDLFTV